MNITERLCTNMPIFVAFINSRGVIVGGLLTSVSGLRVTEGISEASCGLPEML